MAKGKSRTQMWHNAISTAREELEKAQERKAEIEGQVQDLIDELNGLIEPIRDAMQDLIDLQAEYNEWYDNMPYQLQDGPTGAKLYEISNLEIEDSLPEDVEMPDIELDLDSVESALYEAEAADLPLGFGRD